jgi:DNA-binding response OmpR family regulator
MRVLVVEDEQDLANALAQRLTREGYSVDVAYDGVEALSKSDLNEYDIVLLDLNLPEIDGIEVCRQIRKSRSTVGIIILTARVTHAERMLGLNEGADDYVVKPFHFGELLARIRAVLRRGTIVRHKMLAAGDLLLNPNTMQSTFKSHDISLTAKQYAILEYLVLNAGRIVSQEELLEHVWNEEADAFTQVIKTHMNNIRRKLEKAGGNEVISTVKGRGYIISCK